MPHSADLFERSGELEVLQKAMGAAREGHGGAVMIEGAPGIGKTSLLAEGKRMAGSAGLQVATARGSELESDFPFGVVRQLFEPLLAHMDPQERRRVMSGAAGQAAVVLERVVPEDSRGGDFSIPHGLYWLTADICERQPLALLIDDLHWADGDSLRFLNHLMPRLEDLGCCVVGTLRPFGLGTQPQLLDQIVTTPPSVVLAPSKLSPAAATSLITAQFAKSGCPAPRDEHFLSACCAATGGNPLLLKELAEALAAEGVAANAANIPQVYAVGPRAVARRVAVWMRRLPEDCVALTRAVAVLGEGAEVAHAAELAELPLEDALQAAKGLEQAQILFTDSSNALRTRLGFVHPLVRAVIYEGMPPADRHRAHRKAAVLLKTSTAEVETVAPHLLRTLPCGDDETVGMLWTAANSALARGSPGTAATCLRRCLAEPPPPRTRLDLLSALGNAMRHVDTAGAVPYLEEALALAGPSRRRVEIALALGNALLLLQRAGEALAVWRRALADTAPDDTELRNQLHACILSIPLYEPGRQDMREDILSQVSELRSAVPHPGPGGRSLDCVIAGHDAIIGDPRAVLRARSALRDAPAAQQPNGQISVSFGWLALISADRDEVMGSLDAAVEQAHREGSLNGLTGALTYRSLAWLCRGNLEEATADALTAMRAVETSSVRLRRLVLGPVHAEALLERGALDEAGKALEWTGVPDPAPITGLMYYVLHSRARLLRMRGRTAEALDAALAAGRSFSAAGGQNPAIVPWQSEAAVCLHLLGRDQEARALATAELRSARYWSAPRALGRALRVAGALAEGEADLPLLREAVDRLRKSPARLEYAKALADYGAAVRRHGKRREARDALSDALDIAEARKAAPLVRQILDELHLAGIRPHRHAVTGLQSLTPGEQRVHELAVQGKTNREIAQHLFVTTKTVEVHLSSIYRKLGVAGRHELAEKSARTFSTPAPG
ncbi:AAA family ATPase [Streptomyces sp. 205]|uniref:AAA family ATPase n=2 Tax=Streptomyces coffeae TaxID=621382 RepID=A0ABS1NAT7_9ACTN|nr:AAA family ATPase [Streptomyces coffeae]